jgi:hypothetical protein
MNDQPTTNNADLNEISKPVIEASRMLRERGIKPDVSNEKVATLHNFLIRGIENGEPPEKIAKRLDELTPTPPIAKPATSHNAVLDNETHHCTVDFLKYIDDNHLLKKLALSISKATYLPAHTTFLAGLGVFSSIASRKYQVLYPDGTGLPVGMYVVAEQPSGTAKSRCLKTFQQPFFAAEKRLKRKADAELGKLLAVDKKDLSDFEAKRIPELQRLLKTTLFTTNATPEALEQSLAHSNGYFSAVSSEQGLFNTLLGSCYGKDKTSNNDVLLNGFDGGYVSSARVTRSGYIGAVAGGAVMFAQQGGIETILKSSNGTGLAERFLFIAEPHNLGKRDFSQTELMDYELIKTYNELCEPLITSVLENPRDLEELASLMICNLGWKKIAQFRNRIEPLLADGGRYSHVALRGAASKIDMQIMKIAALLHLLDNFERNSMTIAVKHVEAAIAIAHAMMEANLKICTDKGIVGVKAEYMAILSLFENGNKPRTEREVIKVKVKSVPFKDFTGNKSDLIRKTLDDMVTDGVLKLTYSVDDKPIKLYSLAQ